MTDDLPVLATPAGDIGRVIRDPASDDVTTRDLVAAYVGMGALQDALEKQRKAVKSEVTARAAEARERTGAEFKAPVGDVGSAGDAYHQAQVIVGDAEVCAAWIREHHPKLLTEAIQRRTEFDVGEYLIEDILDDLRRFPADDTPALTGRQAVRLARQIEMAVGVKEVTVVHTDVLEREFMKAGTKLIDADGQVVEGVRVIPRRLKWVEIRKDATYARQLEGMFTARLLRTPTDEIVDAEIVDADEPLQCTSWVALWCPVCKVICDGCPTRVDDHGLGGVPELDVDKAVNAACPMHRPSSPHTPDDRPSAVAGERLPIDTHPWRCWTCSTDLPSDVDQKPKGCPICGADEAQIVARPEPAP